MRDSKVFLITGVSSGLGKAFAEGALAAGHRVIGTLRNAEVALMFSGHQTGRAHGVLLDVTDFKAIPATVARAKEQFGPIDVLVNNAGYGHEGILEETTLEELRQQFDVKVCS
jgi:NAD(P)-dependent dehydrogenase (short-subunit alcohol dehydrogenase family)